MHKCLQQETNAPSPSLLVQTSRGSKKQKQARAEDVLQNTDCTQAANITPWQQRNGLSAGAWHCLQWACSICMLLGMMGVHSAFFVPTDVDLSPWHSNSSKRGNKHVFAVNLAQIRLAVPEIFHAQTKKNKKVTALKTEPYLREVDRRMIYWDV